MMPQLFETLVFLKKNVRLTDAQLVSEAIHGARGHVMKLAYALMTFMVIRMEFRSLEAKCCWSNLN